MKTKYAAKKALALLLAVLMGVSILTTAFPVTAQAVETEDDTTDLIRSILPDAGIGAWDSWEYQDSKVILVDEDGSVIPDDSEPMARVMAVSDPKTVYLGRYGWANYPGGTYVTQYYPIWVEPDANGDFHEGDMNYSRFAYCACPSMPGVSAGFHTGDIEQLNADSDVSGATLNVFKAIMITSPYGPWQVNGKPVFQQDFWNWAIELDKANDDGSLYSIIHALLGYVYDPDSVGTPYQWSQTMKDHILGTGGMLEQIIQWAKDNADVCDLVTVYRIKGNGSYQDIVWPEWKPLSTVQLQKVSANPTLTNGNADYSLAGAVYEIYKDSALTKSVGTLTTDASGKSGTIQNLVPGTYYAKEKTAPKGYELVTDTLTVTIASGETGTFQASDPPIERTGSGKLVKQSSKPSVTNGNSYYSLASAEYTVYSDEQLTRSVGVLKTDADGNSNTLELDAGTYYVKETKAPSGYEEDETVHTMVVKSGETSVLKVQDVYIPSRVTLQKASSNSEITDGNDNYSLAGAEYIVYSDQECTTEVGTLTTKEDGSTNTLTLPAGTYYAKESKAPSGFKLNTDVYSVTVKPGETGTFQATDEPVFGRAELLKESANADVTTGNACYSLAGTKYGIYKDEACKDKTGYFITDAEGKTEAIELPAGTYYLREQEAPVGYALDTKIYPISVKCGETTVLHVSDIPIMNPIDLLLQKIDVETKQTAPQADVSLAGAEYTVRFYAGQYKTVADAEASGDPARTWVFRTDDKGQIQYQTKTYFVSGDKLYMGMDGKTPMLPLGAVVIQETKAPEGYLVDANVYLRNITEDGKHVATVQTYTAPTSPE